MKFLQKFSNTALSRVNILLAVTAVILVNLFASMAVQTFSLKLDVTANRLYELSPVTAETAVSLQDKTVITVFANESDYPQVFREMLSRYKKLSPFILIAYVDPYENPALADVYRQKGFTLAENDIVAEGSRRIRHLSAQNMFTTDTAGNIQSIALEQQLTAALMYVNSTRVPSVFFIEGHNERPSASLLNLFTENNFSLRRGVPGITGFDDADIAVIASPSRDFDTEEIRLLDAFLEEGGKLMVFLEPSSVQLRTLGGLLERWNIEVQNNTIFDERAHVSDNPANCVPLFMPHEITRFFADTRLFPVFPASRSLELSSKHGAIKTQELLRTTPSAYAKIGIPSTLTKGASDKTGSFTLAAVAEKQVLSSEGVKNAAIFICGSKNMYGDDVLQTSNYANRDFLIQTVNYLSHTPLSVNIPPKTLARPTLGILFSQSVIIGIFLVGLIPLAIFACGIIVFLRRRNL